MKREDKIRRMMAREAARLMCEDGIKEYRDAKRIIGGILHPPQTYGRL